MTASVIIGVLNSLVGWNGGHGINRLLKKKMGRGGGAVSTYVSDMRSPFPTGIRRKLKYPIFLRILLVPRVARQEVRFEIFYSSKWAAKTDIGGQSIQYHNYYCHEPDTLGFGFDAS